MVGGELQIEEEVEITTAIKFCEDGHRCENGSECVESNVDEGNFYCDCDAAGRDAAFQGLSCEHKATVYCSAGNKGTTTNFCTNGGSCKDYVGVNDEHAGCTCNSNYEGSHCQFVTGTTPTNWHDNTKARTASSSVQVSGAAVFLMALISFTVIIGTSLIVWRGLKKRAGGNIDIDTTSDATSTQNGDLHLELDGSALKDEMSTGESLPHPTYTVEPIMETIMDDEAEII